MKSATAFLPMSSASIRTLAMSGLAGTPKDNKVSFLKEGLPSLKQHVHFVSWEHLQIRLLLHCTKTRLTRNTERQKVQFIVFKTKTKRIGEAWNCL